MRKGFTLIELLAVIVILAIIALIATPIILGIIKDTKKEADKRTVEMYAKAVQNSITKYQLDNNKSIIGKLNPKKMDNNEISKNIITNEKIDLKIDYEGNVVCETIEIYEDGNIYIAGCKVNGESIEYTYGKDQSYDNGQIVYFDVVKGKGCTKDEYESSFDETIGDYLNSSTGYNGIKDENDTSNKNSCLKFYTFNDDGSDKINLLLDHNTTANIRWTSTIVNTEGPTAILPKLAIDTNEWKGTIEPSSYSLDQSIQASKAKYTIDYTGYKARLIEVNEIAKITGADILLNWNEITASFDDFFYFDGAKGTDSTWQTQIANSNSPSEYYWLFARTYLCKKEGCKKSDLSSPAVYGYWTSSSYASSTEAASNGAWFVRYSGAIKGSSKPDISSNGIRPVIEVLKSDL